VSKPVAAKTTTVAAGEKPATPQVATLKQDIEVKSPMPGKIFEIIAKEGSMVKKGEVVLIIESMKMENSVLSPVDAMVKKIRVSKNDIVDATSVLFILGNNPVPEIVKNETKPVDIPKAQIEVPTPIPTAEIPKATPQTHVSSDEIAIKSPMPGMVFQIPVKEGAAVKKGETLVITEFMKMENRVLAPKDAVVHKIFVKEKERVETTTIMLTLK